MVLAYCSKTKRVQRMCARAFARGATAPPVASSATQASSQVPNLKFPAAAHWQCFQVLQPVARGPGPPIANLKKGHRARLSCCCVTGNEPEYCLTTNLKCRGPRDVLIDRYLAFRLLKLMSSSAGVCVCERSDVCGAHSTRNIRCVVRVG